jgi:predicted phage terminase large subunit-like protein
MKALAGGRPVVWAPNSIPQRTFLASGAFEALYGGAAGGGKTDAVIVGGCRNFAHPNYTGIIFRRTFKDLDKFVVPRSKQIVPLVDPGATYNEQKYFWRFTRGGRLILSHLQHEKDVADHQGAEYQYEGWDELTHFTEFQFTYLLSRLRSAYGIPVRVRAGTNPGGVGHDWVFRRYGPWLNPASTPKAESGQTLHYVNSLAGEEYVPRGTPDALGRVFVRALLEDNPALRRNDPQYRSRLMGLDPITRAQLLFGDWLIKPAAGLYFKREWFEIVDAAPAQARRIRYWDRAASEPSKEYPDPDWTRGVRLAEHENVVYVEDVASTRSRPAGVEKLILQTAELDGRGVMIGIEGDPGQAGKYESDAYVAKLAGYDVRVFPARQDKVVRARPFSAQAEAKNVKLVRGHWNEDYLREHVAFPDPHWHDDQVDGSSGGYGALRSTAARDDLPDLSGMRLSGEAQPSPFRQA